MSLCAVGRTVLGHLVLKYSPEVPYYTTLQDVPSPLSDSRCCRNYWLTHRWLPVCHDCTYVPNKIAVIVGHELQALGEMMPSEIMRLEEIKSEDTSPHQVTDVNSLLHVNQASLLRQQRLYWHLIILTVLCASIILGSVCFSLRFRLLTMILNCWTQNNVSTTDCTEHIPNPTTSSPIQDTDEPKDDDLRGSITFTAYPLPQSSWSNLGSCIELVRLTITRKTLQNSDFSLLVPTPQALSCTLHRRIQLTAWRCWV